MSDVASKGVPNMTVEQVERFVEESLDLKWEWERIRLLGGEPTIHPKFREMWMPILEYKKHYPKVFLQTLSNGLGRYKKHKDWMIENGIDPHVEAKSRKVTPRWFENTRIVPIDVEPTVGKVEPCFIFGIRGCGIGLTRYGYFLDGAGASIARVAGIDCGAMTLKEVTWARMYQQSELLCCLCGHSYNQLVSKTGEITGDFWEVTLENYRIRKPELPVYGESS